MILTVSHMNRKWMVWGLSVLAGLAVATAPVAAASSSTDRLIWGLNTKLLAVAIAISILVEAILLYTVLRFRNNDDPKPTLENRRLEITWTVATALILLFVGVSAFSVLAEPDVTKPGDDQISPDETEIKVVAETWAWNFYYPNHGNFSTTNEVIVPTNETVYFSVTSKRWIHSFHVPDMSLKQDALPGQVNTIRTVPEEPGTYQGYCAEYCGVGHSGMMFTVTVVPQDEYEDELADACEDGGGTWDATNATCQG